MEIEEVYGYEIYRFRYGLTGMFSVYPFSGCAIDLLRYEAVFLCLIPGGDNHGADSGK